MEENQFNNISKKLFENYQLEKLPFDFTEKLMVRLEKEKIADIKAQPLISKKFLTLIMVTFLSIVGIAFIANGNSGTTETGSEFADKFKFPDFDFSQILKLFNFNIELSLFIKLVIIAVIGLLVIDKISGSVVDFFLDSKTKANNMNLKG